MVRLPGIRLPLVLTAVVAVLSSGRIAAQDESQRDAIGRCRAEPAQEESAGKAGYR
jgi:hypothetical protein